ncbi:MAG: CoA transferase [Chloroflexi bacterium]|nr:CoA transferase [Chloroflexota bacterium]
MAASALSGFKVVEWAHFIAGPYCAKLLADMGAEVIKVEEPPAGDEARRHGPFPGDLPHPEHSGLFLSCNTNKLGITLDPHKATGRQIFLRLLSQADVLIEDNPPLILNESHLDYEALAAVNPRLVVTSITPFGQTGPYRDYRAYYLNLFHGSGRGYLMPHDSPNLEREPVKAGTFLGEFESGLSAAVATLGALYARYATGVGQHVDVSKQEAFMALERVEIGKYPNEGSSSQRASGRRMFGGLMPCADGYVEIAVAQDKQWRGLCDLMGHPEWTKEERCRTEQLRSQNVDDLVPLLAEWVAQQPRDRLFHEGQARGAAVGAVYTAEDVVNSPQLAARAFFFEMEHPKVGRVKMPSAPYKMSKTPWRLGRVAPEVGQHNDEIYGGRLGLSRQELARLREVGVI